MTTAAPELQMASSGPDTCERRSEARARAVSMIVKVIRANDAGLFRARNISDSGIMLVAHVPFEVGEAVSIELSRDLTVQGHIAWCDGDLCGAAFEQPIDSAAALKSIAAEKLKGQRQSRRLPVSRLATIYSECGIRAVTITDVSPRGVGFTHNGSLHVGDIVRLVLESGVTHAGAVCWSRDGHAGVRLSDPFTCEELESASCI